MGSLTTMLFFLCSFVLIVTPHSYTNAENYPNLNRNIYNTKETQTNLHYYVHNIKLGPNQTAWLVAQSNMTDDHPTLFGSIYVLDDLVTSGPTLDSEPLGRLQGAYSLSDMKELAPTMILNLVFTEGMYNGSVLSILGRNPLSVTEREFSVVGGTSAFRMARGYVVCTTPVFTAEYVVYECNAVVSHNDVLGLGSSLSSS